MYYINYIKFSYDVQMKYIKIHKSYDIISLEF